jgi:hypothetical protein
MIRLANESSHLRFGFYVGIIAAAALAAGGFLMFKEKSGAWAVRPDASRGFGESP